LNLLRTCRQARIGAYLVIHDKRVIPWLARLLGREDWSDYLMTGASIPEWVAAIKSRLPHYRTVLIMESPPADVMADARAAGASYVHVTSPTTSRITTDWIRLLHRAELGIVLTASDSLALTWQRKLEVEAIVVDEPSFEHISE
jgi:hypothetical protein